MGLTPGKKHMQEVLDILAARGQVIHPDDYDELELIAKEIDRVYQ